MRVEFVGLNRITRVSRVTRDSPDNRIDRVSWTTIHGNCNLFGSVGLQLECCK
jgi:hypothetical protein